MHSYLLVAAGGALGATLRYGLSRALAGSGPAYLPTFAANIVGSLLIGVLAGWAMTRGAAAEPLRLLLGVGLLGGFTTFSAYSLETAQLIERGRLAEALAYAAVCVVLALIAAFLGLWAARRFLGVAT